MKDKADDAIDKLCYEHPLTFEDYDAIGLAASTRKDFLVNIDIWLDEASGRIPGGDFFHVIRQFAINPHASAEDLQKLSGLGGPSEMLITLWQFLLAHKNLSLETMVNIVIDVSVRLRDDKLGEGWQSRIVTHPNFDQEKALFMIEHIKESASSETYARARYLCGAGQMWRSIKAAKRIV